jgi:hypothetical protein
MIGERVMNWARTAALAFAVLVAAVTRGFAADGVEPKNDSDNVQVMQAQIERELYVGMYAIKEFCKQKYPALAKAYDDIWAETAAEAPPALKSFADSPDFAALLAERMKDLAAGSKSAEQAAQIDDVCARPSSKP